MKAATDRTSEQTIAPMGTQSKRFFSRRGSATIATNARAGSAGMASSQFIR